MAPTNCGIQPCPCDLPRCPRCNYTIHDAGTLMDHGICKREGGRIPEAPTITPESRESLLTQDGVERFIRSLPWSSDTPDTHKTLVAGNIRNFAARVSQEFTRVQQEALAQGWDEGWKARADWSDPNNPPMSDRNPHKNAAA